MNKTITLDYTEYLDMVNQIDGYKSIINNSKLLEDGKCVFIKTGFDGKTILEVASMGTCRDEVILHLLNKIKSLSK